MLEGAISFPATQASSESGFREKVRDGEEQHEHGLASVAAPRGLVQVALLVGERVAPRAPVDPHARLVREQGVQRVVDHPAAPTEVRLLVWLTPGAFLKPSARLAKSWQLVANEWPNHGQVSLDPLQLWKSTWPITCQICVEQWPNPDGQCPIHSQKMVIDASTTVW